MKTIEYKWKINSQRSTNVPVAVIEKADEFMDLVMNLPRASAEEIVSRSDFSQKNKDLVKRASKLAESDQESVYSRKLQDEIYVGFCLNETEQLMRDRGYTTQEDIELVRNMVDGVQIFYNGLPKYFQKI